MDTETINNKILNFFSKVTKQGSKYSKFAVQEFNLMVLMEKKARKIEELGQIVYKLIKKKVSGIEKDKTVSRIIEEIKKIENEEIKIKKTPLTAQKKSEKTKGRK